MFRRIHGKVFLGWLGSWDVRGGDGGRGWDGDIVALLLEGKRGKEMKGGVGMPFLYKVAVSSWICPIPHPSIRPLYAQSLGQEGGAGVGVYSSYRKVLLLDASKLKTTHTGTGAGTQKGHEHRSLPERENL